MTVCEKAQLSYSLAGLHFLFSVNVVAEGFSFVGLHDYVNALRTGDIVNPSENRAAWHAEFRNPNAVPLVKDSLSEIKRLSETIRNQAWHFDVQYVVNIGIGGSDLGPKLICEAFANEMSGPEIHFLSNLDLTELHEVVKKIKLENTLFIATSKSFRTLETLENMNAAKQLLLALDCDPAKHFIAVTADLKAAVELNQIPASQVLVIPGWVGGRYSIWSAVGLVCAIAFGFEKFYQLHQGAYQVDQHFFSAPLAENIPVIYATQLHEAIQNNNLKVLTVLPYAHRLRTLPDYLQQLFMESLGKSVNQAGEKIDYCTGPIVYGSVGTNSQHSFQQLMMQGTHPVFADFILPLSQSGLEQAQQKKLIANCVTQVKTLRQGAAHADLRKNIVGGQHANLIAIDTLNFESVGALIAFYEHVVESTAFLMDINPFDQFGVEYAKGASEHLHAAMDDKVMTVEKIVAALESA
jgi:glucose-6-phosphate isomerase